MKATLLSLAVASSIIVTVCGSQRDASAAPEPPIKAADAAGYDDRQIAMIKRGQTTEPKLLEWFGRPESRDLKPDGRAQLNWAFSRTTDGGPGNSGVLSVRLAPDGKVDAYSARRGPSMDRRTADFVETSDTDIRQHMDQWSKEGWTVLSVARQPPQADGSVHWQAELSRQQGNSATKVGYDDRHVATIKRAETTETQLLELFGPASSRDLKPDGRAQLTWSFAGRLDGGSGDSGALNVSLAPNGKVDSYSARRGPH